MSRVEDPDLQKEQSNDNLNVLLLYQGEFATSPREEITKFFRSQSKTVDIKLVSEGDPSTGNSAFKEFVSLIPECHAAIALLTPDDRYASAAGNLWFEIGYWLATKPPETLLMLELKGLDKKTVAKDDEVPVVAMISNLLDKNYKSVEAGQWLKGVFNFIEGRNKELQNRQLKEEEIEEQVFKSKEEEAEEQVFKWVFSHFPEKASLNEFSHCKCLPDPPCSFRRKALVLTAELLSMFKIQQKLLLAQDALRRISFHTSILVELRNESGTHLERTRIDYGRELAQDFIDLQEQLEILHESPDSWRSFLASRILHHQKHYKAARYTARHLPNRELSGMKEMDISARINDFFTWSENFQHAYKSNLFGYKQFCRYGMERFNEDRDRESIEFWNQLDEHRNFSWDVSRALSGWAFEFYTDWHKQIVEAMESPGSFHDIMKKFLKALPHNDSNNCPFERTWVQEDEYTRNRF